ncbi:MAG TPA: trypsin-like serine protease [Candidatus Udaeobacter sp.]|nr:trypsin-like serine protease [Candidatus Udaeobacter sp.]
MKKQSNNSKRASALQITVSVGLICISLILLASISGAGSADSRSQGVVMSQEGNASEVLSDFTNARPMPIPRATAPMNMAPSPPNFGTPGFAPGAVGNGETHPVTLPLPKVRDRDSDMEIDGNMELPGPDEFGTGNQPFSTARADFISVATNTYWPYRASGKLTFQDSNGNSYWCSASLIKRGVVVTAAHCVAAYGSQRYYSNFKFTPGYRSGVAPYGVWTAAYPLVTNPWWNGTDGCSGVVCPDDVAVLVLRTDSSGKYAGTYTGWYAYGWNGYGFVNGLTTHITQIGYPGCLDNGELMERNDSQGFVSSSSTSNTIIGTLMRQGSSGGPWLNNFGVRPTLTDGTIAGSAAAPNTVVGVTSWLYNDDAVKSEGASPFTSSNIASLITTVCGFTPAACE